MSGIGSNSEHAIDGLAARYREAMGHARLGGSRSLKDFRAAGAALHEMKGILLGRFGSEIERRLGCSRQWAARLIQLDREWEDVVAAFRWAEEAKPKIAWSSYGVDSALRLAKMYRASKGGPQASGGRRSSRPRSKIREELAAALEQVAALKNDVSRARKELAAAETALADMKLRWVNDVSHARKELAAAETALADMKLRWVAAKGNVAFLDEQLAELRERLADCEGMAWSSAPQPIDDITKEKVRKIGAYFFRATEGEQISAAHKIYVVADRLGWTFEDLLAAACGYQM
jgi:hypothetical protein